MHFSSAFKTFTLVAFTLSAYAAPDCTSCLADSVAKVGSCSSLDSAALQEIQDGVRAQSTSDKALGIPAEKKCICDWLNTFNGGAASSCNTPTFCSPGEWADTVMPTRDDQALRYCPAPTMEAVTAKVVKMESQSEAAMSSKSAFLAAAGVAVLMAAVF